MTAKAWYCEYQGLVLAVPNVSTVFGTRNYYFVLPLSLYIYMELESAANGKGQRGLVLAVGVFCGDGIGRGGEGGAVVGTGLDVSG